MSTCLYEHHLDVDVTVDVDIDGDCYGCACLQLHVPTHGIPPNHKRVSQLEAGTTSGLRKKDLGLT